jgi:hypothetical protein
LTDVKTPLIRVAVGGASGVFVYLLGGGGVASFLAGVIVSVFLRRHDAIDAKYQVSEQKRSPRDTVSGGDV